MRWHKRIRVVRDGIDLAADIDAVIAVNTGQSSSTTRVAQTRSVAIAQDRRRASDPAPPRKPDPKEPR
jgi:hypothetical protein